MHIGSIPIAAAKMNYMIELAIDIETYSSGDITCGIHKYIESNDFEILMIAYKYSFEDHIRFIDLKNPYNKDEFAAFIRALFDDNIIKTAYNVAFEFNCFRKYFNLDISLKQWSCTMALGAQAGLPFGLDAAAKVAGMEQKDKKGKDLIKYFSIPCKPTKTNGGRTRNLPEHDPEKWKMFCDYCIQDVATEQSVRDYIRWFDVSQFEKPVWEFDQKVNNRGVQIDTAFVHQALRIDAEVVARLMDEAKELTGLENPNSDVQIKRWIFEKTKIEIPSLAKTEMPLVLEWLKDYPEVLKVLRIREMLSYSSLKKYVAMRDSVNSDGRIRGLIQYYGANRTGRFAGRNVQVQNLTRGSLDAKSGELEMCRQLVLKGNLNALSLIYDDLRTVLSSLIRSAFIAKQNYSLVVSDSAQIEARVVAWLAGEKWRNELFKDGKDDLYKVSASAMFGIPVSDITKELRTRGKISELALGFQGSVGALMRMSQIMNAGLNEDEAPKIVKQWRLANPNIVRFWYDCQNAAIEAINNPGLVSKVGYVSFYVSNKNLLIVLPSGRKLVYLHAWVAESRKFEGMLEVCYYGIDQKTGQWTKQETYGGKIVENIVQATARDVLVNAMLNVEKAGYEIVMHVHDELIAEAPDSSIKKAEKEITEIMTSPIKWAPRLVLGAETFVSKYYKK